MRFSKWVIIMLGALGWICPIFSATPVDAASIMTINGASGARQWGGKFASTLTIFEFLP